MKTPLAVILLLLPALALAQTSREMEELKEEIRAAGIRAAFPNRNQQWVDWYISKTQTIAPRVGITDQEYGRRMTQREAAFATIAELEAKEAKYREEDEAAEAAKKAKAAQEIVDLKATVAELQKQIEDLKKQPTAKSGP